jgi:hypothetical protein
MIIGGSETGGSGEQEYGEPLCLSGGGVSDVGEGSSVGDGEGEYISS